MKARILLYVLAAISGALFACAAAANAQCPCCQNGQCPAQSPPLAPTTTVGGPSRSRREGDNNHPATATLRLVTTARFLWCSHTRSSNS